MIDEMMKRFCFILSVLFCFLTSFGQGLKISEVKETTSGTDAFHAPIDEDGHPCGLVKVLAAFPDLQFDGNVVGDVTPENNEYKVYLAKGSKQLVIKRSGVLPVFVDFPTYGIPEISSKATYTVKLKEVSLNPQKNSLVIDKIAKLENIVVSQADFGAKLSELSQMYQIDAGTMIKQLSHTPGVFNALSQQALNEKVTKFLAENNTAKLK